MRFGGARRGPLWWEDWNAVPSVLSLSPAPTAAVPCLGELSTTEADGDDGGCPALTPDGSTQHPTTGEGPLRKDDMINGRSYNPADQTKTIRIPPSETADTRTCDFANVSKETLLASSRQHIADVGLALAFFQQLLTRTAVAHDTDKLTDIDSFHADFIQGFVLTEWWQRHKLLNRHHLTEEDGIPVDVNLIDVLDYIADCVMAGMARSGTVYPLQLSPALLERAFQGTVELLKAQVIIEPKIEVGV